VISIIVPIRREVPADAERRLEAFAREPDCELLVADGDGSRGARLARAAEQARGDVLFFLHADSCPPDGALDLVRRTLESGADAGAFSLAYEDGGPAMRWIAWWANRRSRAWKLPFGDQGIFCRRSAYERSGGFRDLPICDDLDFVLRLRRAGRFVVRPERTRTSPRRYREVGALRQMLRNWKVMLGYFAGVAPAKLARWYEGD
jgi:hypothetical protein